MMDDKNLTGWFLPETKPVHHGWYQVRAHDNLDDEHLLFSNWFAHWNGVRWSATFDGRYFNGSLLGYFRGEPQRRYSNYQCLQWRGIARDAL